MLKSAHFHPLGGQEFHVEQIVSIELNGFKKKFALLSSCLSSVFQEYHLNPLFVVMFTGYCSSNIPFSVQGSSSAIHWIHIYKKLVLSFTVLLPIFRGFFKNIVTCVSLFKIYNRLGVHKILFENQNYN